MAYYQFVAYSDQSLAEDLGYLLRALSMFGRHRRQVQQTVRCAMTRVLCTTLLGAVGVTQASAQTAASQQLLELDDDERNAAFTLMLRDGNRKCDQVVRTLFKGTILGVDEWEAMCRNRISYSFTVLAEPNETMIMFVSCRRLLATSRMLLQRAGSKSKATGCRIK
jgi:hypothetical protein